MSRFYDVDNRRLIYVSHAASEEFWDAHWDTADFRKATTATPNSWVARTTMRYLSQGKTILEGGCGYANHVYALQNKGYNVIGCDFAKITVEKINQAVPEIDVRLGDVRKLPFNDGYFDGYWSLGVIEHFWNGYEDIAKEMHRVLRKDGYLFLTFPAMSPLRKLKAKTKKYSLYLDGSNEPKDFYQFALNSAHVVDVFHELGFQLITEKGMGGFKGVKDEIALLSPLFTLLQNSSSLFSRVLKRGINEIMPAYIVGHMRLLVLRKL